MPSGVETSPPPGWLVSRLQRNHERPDRVWWARCAGSAKYGQTREAACRLAWERWAVDVIGHRVRWIQSTVEGYAPWIEVTGDGDPLRGDIECSQLYSESGPVGWGITVQWESPCERDPIADPVEALAALAAMALALFGPPGRDMNSTAAHENGA